MKSAFLILGWLFYSSLVAQQPVLYQKFNVCRQSDTVHLNIPKWTPLQDFFSGVFFKRVDESVIKVPTRNYKDRFLKCENCEIANYSVDLLNGGQVCLKGLDLRVEPTEKMVVLTTTSKSGETLSQVSVLLSPKMTFYLKINESLVKIDGNTPMPDFLIEDEISLVARAESGKMMNVVDHFLIPLDSFIEKYSNDTPVGGKLADWEKSRILDKTRGHRFAIRITFSDATGNNEWDVKMPFFK